MTTTPPFAELRRCPTCNRWGGRRSLGADGSTVELHPTDHRGPCNEGPWHGSLRGPRNACGQWLRWSAIVAPAPQSVCEGIQSPPSPPSSSRDDSALPSP